MMRKAITNIFSSYNNVLMTATDPTGVETIATCSGGQVVKSLRTPAANSLQRRAAERMADQLKEKEFTQVIVKKHLVETSPTIQVLVLKQQSELWTQRDNVTRIEDVTPIAHDVQRRWSQRPCLIRRGVKNEGRSCRRLAKGQQD